jgi:hypothetical protein
MSEKGKAAQTDVTTPSKITTRISGDPHPSWAAGLLPAAPLAPRWPGNAPITPVS